jgi:hypothetical protein
VFELIQIFDCVSIALNIDIPVHNIQISISANKYASPVLSFVEHFAHHIHFFLFLGVVTSEIVEPLAVLLFLG